MMKGRKKMVLMMIEVLLCCCGSYIYLLKYFFYNKYNIHAQRAALEKLEKMYDQDFELLSTEFETKEEMVGGAKYKHTWKFLFQDEQKRQFYVYVNMYGLVKTGDGNFHAPDYFSYVSDTYGQF